MKILLSCTYYKPNISGITVYVSKLADLMSEKYKVTILTSGTKVENKDAKIKIIYSKILFKIGKGVFMPRFFIDAFWSVKNTDVVNAHLPQIEAIILALWSKFFKKRFVVTHHCSFDFNGTISNKIVAALTFVPHFLTYLLADKIVSYTDDYAKNNFFLKLFLNKVVFILPPTWIEKEDKDYSKVLSSHKKQGDRVIGFAGRVAWEKGVDILINAVNSIPNTKLLIAGPYRNVVGDQTGERIFLKNKKNKKVIFLGPLERKKLMAFYKFIDCLVLPSTNSLETFGIVQAEAMLWGKPVIASNLPGVRVPVKLTGMGEICSLGNSYDLANKIILVFDKKFKNTANYFFNIQVFFKKYQSLFLSFKN